jgi:hypothetical protein
MNERRANVLRNHLAMAAMLGGMPIGFGIAPEWAHLRLVPSAQRDRVERRPMAERKERRRKRKQRRNR